MKIKCQIRHWIMLMIFLLPVLDIYKSVVGNSLELFGISFVEILNLIYILGLIILFYLKFKTDKILPFNWKLIVMSVLIFVVYLIGHFVNISHLKEGLISTANINYVVELYHIIISYVFPLIILFIFCHINISYHDIVKALLYLGLIISSVIVITNIFEVSYVAYSSYYENNTKILGSIFSWAKELETCSDVSLYTSRGLFYSANQISAELSGLTFLTALYALKSDKLLYYLYLFIDFIALLMLSTKTGLICIFLSCFAIWALQIYIYIRTKKNISTIRAVVIPICLAVVMTGLFTISPVKYKLNIFMDNFTNDKSAIQSVVENTTSNSDLDEQMVVETTTSNSVLEDQEAVESKTSNSDLVEENVNSNLENSNNIDQLLSDEQIAQMIKTSYSSFGIHQDFIELYNVDTHIDFWKEFIKKPLSEISNFRNTKYCIYKDILKKNENELGDRLFGIGYTSSFPGLERDVFSQNIFYGYFGTIFMVIPFFAVFLYSAIKVFLKPKKYLDIKYYALILASAYILLASIYTGHVFGNFVPSTVLAIILGTLLSVIKNSNIKNCDNDNLKN